MTRARRCRQAATGLLALLGAQPLLAGVTVNVATRAGAAVESTVIVFDPLDETPPPGRAEASIDQVNKQFVPHVSVIRTGTAVSFPNSDRIRHQVYSFSPAKTFSLKLYSGPSKAPVVFDKPGLVVLGCNIHDKMLGFVVVVDTPYFAKTAGNGSASLDLPAGRYRLRAWNPKAAAIPAQQIVVGPAPMSIALQIDLDTSASTVAAWPE